jgi:hypothetical protein
LLKFAIAWIGIVVPAITQASLAGGALPKQIRFLGHFLDNRAQRKIDVLPALDRAHLTHIRFTKVNLVIEYIEL